MKGTLRLFLTLCMAVLSMTLVQAQERTYSGVVKGSDGEPIIGASVEVVGTTTGTSTGLDGDFTIQAKQGSKLKFSFLGTKAVTVTAGSSTTINVVLEDDVTGLDEVVVQAFGTTKKKDLTGSISTIDSKLISSQSNSTLTKALEGAVPGLQVASIEGQPGMDAGIRIRGIGSASQSNSNALVVIDGVPYENTYGYGKNILSSLNPKDIESISVLKDAASTALYGSRGANGVVLVTTKKGKQGKAKITFEGKWGINMIANNEPNLVRDVDTNYELMWEGIYNTVRYGSSQAYTSNYKNPNMSHEEAALFASQHLFNFTGSTTSFNDRSGLGNWMYYRVPGATYQKTGSGTKESATMLDAYLIDPATGKISANAEKLYDVDDWRNFVFKRRFRQEYTVSVSGATDKTDYYISAGYLSDPSYIANSNFERYNIRSNINTQVTKWLKAGLNMAYNRRSTQLQNGRYSSRNMGAAVQNAFTWVGYYMPMASAWQRDMDGNLMYENGNKVMVAYNNQQQSPVGGATPKSTSTSETVGYNLLYQMDYSKTRFIQDQYTTTGYVEAKFLKDFTFNARMSLDQSFNQRQVYLPKAYGESAGTEQGMMGRYHSTYYTVNAQQTLNWAHDFGKHHVDVLVGHEYDWNFTNEMNYKASYSLFDKWDAPANFIWLNNGGTFSGIGYGDNRLALEGYFGRLNYIFDNKYYITGSVRTDGSSKFKDVSKRWGVFWSVGAAWRISAEEWMQNASSWLTDLKIRADYGVTGNQSGIGYYSGYQTWTYAATGYTTPGSYQPAGWKLTQGATPNDALSWEKRKTIDAGLDFRLWDRFYGTLDWYQTNTTDILMNAPISFAMTGQTSLTQNCGELRTRGFEFDLGVDIIKTPNTTWSFGVNGAHYKVKTISVPETMINMEDALHDQKWWQAGPDNWNALGAAGGGSNMFAYRRWIGGDYYNLVAAKYMGVDKNTGLPMFGALVTEENHSKFPDANVGDVVATTDHTEAYMFDMGDATPDLIGGFSTSFRWKNLDFSATFAFQIGGLFFSHMYADYIYASSNVGARYLSQELVGNMFNANNENAKFPMMFASPFNGQDTYVGGNRVNAGNTYTDLAIFDASYLSVKNITIGYSLPQKWMDKAGIGGVRIYASFDNMWLIARQGIDPRNSLTGGYDVGPFPYPQIRSCSLGVNITF